MRTDSLLLVLDEPTASLDASSEHNVFLHYMKRARTLARTTGAATIVVSHRFSSVAEADQIIVLERGQVVETGAHQDLLAQGGRYAELYGIQARAYSERMNT